MTAARRHLVVAAVVLLAGLLAGVTPAGAGSAVAAAHPRAALTAAPATASLPVQAPAGAGAFTPLAPQRILDTRLARTRLAAGETRVVPVAGHGGVPPAGVVAVALTVTAVDAGGSGFLTAWPGGPRPIASVLNVVSGDVRANLVVVPLGPGGTVSVYSMVAADLLVDVAGVWTAAPGPVAAGRFVPRAPLRVLDTRDGTGGTQGPLAPGAPVRLDLSGAVPSGASAVAVSVTATDAVQDGYVTVWPDGAPPVVSNLNLHTGGTRADLALVPLAADGSIQLLSTAGGALVVDVVGSFTGPADDQSVAGLLVPVAPVRMADTRTRAMGSRQLASMQVLSLRVGGRGGLPANPAAVVGNLTLVDPVAAGWASAYPARTAWPGSSNVNAEVAGLPVPVGFAVGLTDGRLAVTASVPSDVVVDVTGWFVPDAPLDPTQTAPDSVTALVMPPPGEVLPITLVPGTNLAGPTSPPPVPPAGKGPCMPVLPVPALDSGQVPAWALAVPADARGFVFGWSSRGRPLIAWTRSGAGPVQRRVLVTAAIHGDEDEVAPIIQSLGTVALPAGLQLTVIPALNPDGLAAWRRQNGRGVDMNRNFPIGVNKDCPIPGFYGGPSPLSELETQALAALANRLRPDVFVDYHSNLDQVISTDLSLPLAQLYAGITGQAIKTGNMGSYQEPWAESLPWSPRAILVELPGYSAFTPDYTAAHVRAVLAVAGF